MSDSTMRVRVEVGNNSELKVTRTNCSSMDAIQAFRNLDSLFMRLRPFSSEDVERILAFELSEVKSTPVTDGENRAICIAVNSKTYAMQVTFTGFTVVDHLWQLSSICYFASDLIRRDLYDDERS